MNIREKIQLLPQNVKEYFDSNSVRLDLKKSLFLYDIPEDEIEKISGQVGLVFVKDFHLSDLPKEIIAQYSVSNGIAYGIAYEINDRIFMRFPAYFRDTQALALQWRSTKALPILSEAAAQKKVMEAEPWMFEPDLEEDKKEKIETLPLLDALAKYPRINDQIITTNRLKIRSERETVRGSVRNWLRAYRDSVGVREHSAIERGQFLFQSENAKKLPLQERDRVAVLLKALDDRETLTVNFEQQEIVFPVTMQFQSKKPQSSEELTSKQVQSTEQSPKATQFLESFAKKMAVEKPVSDPTGKTSAIVDTVPLKTPAATSFLKKPLPLKKQALPVKSFNFSRGVTASNTASLPATPAASPITFIDSNAVKPTTISMEKNIPGKASSDAFRFSSGHTLPSEAKKNVAELARSSWSRERKPIMSPSFSVSGRSSATSFGMSDTLKSSENPKNSSASSVKKEVWQIPTSIRDAIESQQDKN